MSDPVLIALIGVAGTVGAALAPVLARGVGSVWTQRRAAARARVEAEATAREALVQAQVTIGVQAAELDRLRALLAPPSGPARVRVRRATRPARPGERR